MEETKDQKVIKYSCLYKKKLVAYMYITIIFPNPLSENACIAANQALVGRMCLNHTSKTLF